MTLQWQGQGARAKGVAERSFSVAVDGRKVPGVLFAPEARAANSPLVLIGHGGSGHKRQAHIVSLARRLARHDGIASASIDGPAHGERRPHGSERISLEQARRRFLSPATTDAMIVD